MQRLVDYFNKLNFIVTTKKENEQKHCKQFNPRIAIDKMQIKENCAA